MGYPGLDFMRLRICNDSLHATGFPCIWNAMNYCEDSLHATGFLGMQQFRVLTYAIARNCAPDLTLVFFRIFTRFVFLLSMKSDLMLF